MSDKPTAPNANVLIETVGYDMRPLFIAKNKIMAMQENNGNHEQTRLIMANSDDSEEWGINESLSSFRVKYDNS